MEFLFKKGLRCYFEIPHFANASLGMTVYILSNKFVKNPPFSCHFEERKKKLQILRRKFLSFTQNVTNCI